MKKNLIILLIVVGCLVLLCILPYVFNLKYNGATKESRQLVLQKKYDATDVIDETELENNYMATREKYILVAANFKDNKKGLAIFKKQGSKTYELETIKYNDDSDIIVYGIPEHFTNYHILFLDKPNLDYVEITYDHSEDVDEPENAIETKKYDAKKDKILCVNATMDEPAKVTFYDTNGNKYEWKSKGL
jgi:hypothetical protein